MKKVFAILFWLILLGCIITAFCLKAWLVGSLLIVIAAILFAFRIFLKEFSKGMEAIEEISKSFWR